LQPPLTGETPMPRVPGIHELAGSDKKAEHSDAQPAVTTSGGVAVGVDATVQVSNLETKAAHVEDARLADLKNRADVYAEDWRRAASRLLGVSVLTGMVGRPKPFRPTALRCARSL